MKRITRFGLIHGFVVLMIIFFFISMQSPAQAEEIIIVDSPTLKSIVEKGVLRVGVNPIFKPFSFINEKKERVGVDIDIANLLAKGLGVKVEIVVPEAFNDLIPMLLNNEIDIIMAAFTRNFKRSKSIDFTDAYYDTGLSIMFNKVKAGKLGLSAVNSYEQLMKKLKERGREDQLIIAVAEGRSPARSTPVFFPNSKIKGYPTKAESAEAVAKGEAHIMVHDEFFLKTWVQDNKEKTMFSIIVFPEPFKPDHYCFAIRKGNQGFLNILNVFIKELYAEGYLKSFMSKYLK